MLDSTSSWAQVMTSASGEGLHLGGLSAASAGLARAGRLDLVALGLKLVWLAICWIIWATRRRSTWPPPARSCCGSRLDLALRRAGRSAESRWTLSADLALILTLVMETPMARP